MRFLRFNLVSALGTAVQLGLLAVLIRFMPPATAGVLAVAVAVVHNFVWHWRWTWADARRADRAVMDRFVRFALANGVVSIAGTAIVMRLLAGTGAVPPLAANLVAIGACGLVNFRAAGRLVFRSDRPDWTCAKGV